MYQLPILVSILMQLKIDLSKTIPGIVGIPTCLFDSRNQKIGTTVGKQNTQIGNNRKQSSSHNHFKEIQGKRKTNTCQYW